MTACDLGTWGCAAKRQCMPARSKSWATHAQCVSYLGWENACPTPQTRPGAKSCHFTPSVRSAVEFGECTLNYKFLSKHIFGVRALASQRHPWLTGESISGESYLIILLTGPDWPSTRWRNVDGTPGRTWEHLDEPSSI